MYRLLLTATLQGKQKQYFYYPHSTDGKTEVRRVLDGPKTVGCYPEFLIL